MQTHTHTHTHRKRKGKHNTRKQKRDPNTESHAVIIPDHEQTPENTERTCIRQQNSHSHYPVSIASPSLPPDQIMKCRPKMNALAIFNSLQSEPATSSKQNKLTKRKQESKEEEQETTCKQRYLWMMFYCRAWGRETRTVIGTGFTW